MGDEEVRAELTRLVDLMTGLGWVDAEAVTAQHQGKPVVGTRGKWNGKAMEMTFYRGSGDAMMLRNMEAAIRRHSGKLWPVRGRAQA